MKAAAYIYALRCPETNEVRYIGKAKDPHSRLGGHIRSAGLRNRPLGNWIASLLKRGKRPSMTIEASCIGDWRPVEVAMIAQYRELTGNMLNVADGGDHVPMTVEQRRENSRSMATKFVKGTDDYWARGALKAIGETAKSMEGIWSAEKMATYMNAANKLKSIYKRDRGLFLQLVRAKPTIGKYAGA